MCKGPCTQIVHTLAVEELLHGHFGPRFVEGSKVSRRVRL